MTTHPVHSPKGPRHVPLTRRFRFGFSFAALLAWLVATPVSAQSPQDGFTSNIGVYSSSDFGWVRALAVQPDGRALVGGEFIRMEDLSGSVVRNRIGRLTASGRIDPTFNPNANDIVYALAVQSDGKILVGGAFTVIGSTPQARSGIARLNVDGSVDISFAPDAAGGAVLDLALQTDGKIVVAGEFTTLNGTARNRIGRLNADGTLDTTFDPGPGAAGPYVATVAIQADRKILVGGSFTELGGQPRTNIGRLNQNGSLDAGFSPTTTANGSVLALAVEPDGQILVGGEFTTLGGGVRRHLGRLNRDGSLDAGFLDLNVSGSPYVDSVVVQPDGKILVGGSFFSIGGEVRPCLARLNSDGSLDQGFGASVGTGTIVSAMAIRPDGRILVGGWFITMGLVPAPSLAQVHADGSLDVDFAPVVGSGTPGSTVVDSIAVQANGKIVVGGHFSNLAGCGANCRFFLGRLNPDGALDTAFNPGANGRVWALAIQPDGKILVGGFFTTIGGGGSGGAGHAYLARLNPDGTIDSTFLAQTNGGVQSIVVQTNGQILVGGLFTQLGTVAGGMTTRNRIGRLNADGTLDTSFNPGANGQVNAIAVQRDGKILVGGAFTGLGSGTGASVAWRIGRLLSDGTFDSTFSQAGASAPVNAIAVQPGSPTDKVLVAGDFSALGPPVGGMITRLRIGRFMSDGVVDTSFVPAGANNQIFALQLLTNGQVLVGGNFTALGTQALGYIGRLNPDGSLDTFFNTTTNGQVNSLAPQPDGKVLVGGYFSSIAGGGSVATTRQKIARLSNNYAPAVQNLGLAYVTASPGGGATTNTIWTRSGEGPELQRATYDYSADGFDFSPIGSLARDLSLGGWFSQSQGWPVNTNVFVRARGYYGTGILGSSGSVAESVRQVYISCPVIQSPGGVPVGTVGTAYSATFIAPEAVGRISWSVQTSSGLPAGLTFVDGVLAGMPAEAGSVAIQIQAFDFSSGCGGSADYTLTINPGTGTTIVVNPPTLPNGTVSTAYMSTTITQTGGTNPASFAVTSGMLPTSLTLSSGGLLSGTPSAAGTYSFRVTATDAAAATGSRDYTVTINPATGPTITLNPPTLPSGTVGTAYPSTTITQTGGTNPATFAVTSGALPTSLTLSSGGLLSGTPSVAGSFSFTVTATDAGAFTGSRSYTVTISPAPAPPSITTQPQSQTVVPGGSALLSVVATGAAPLSYQWYQGSSGTTTTPMAGATASMFTTPGLTTETSYWVRVFSPHGSVNSTTATVTPLPAVGRPSGLYVKSMAGNLVTFAWTAGQGQAPIVDHLIEGGILGQTQILAQLPTGSPTTVFTLTVPTGTFWVHVRAVAGTGTQSEPSDQIPLCVNTACAALTPTNVLGLTNGSDVALAWRTPLESGVPTRITLQVSGSLTTALDLPGTAEAFAYSGVPPGTYNFALVACTAMGCSPASPPITLSFPGACSGPPAVPAKFAVSKAGNTITVDWELPASGPAATSFVLNVTGAFVGSVPTAGKRLAGAVGPGSYTLSVAAVNACGTGTPTAPITETVP